MNKDTSIVKLMNRVIGVPWLIHPDSLDTILSIVSAHTGIEINLQGKPALLPGSVKVESIGGVAIIPVVGVLSHHRDEYMEWLFGETSYETIAMQFRAALADPQVHTIAFLVDSPGGEAAGCFDLVDELFAARGTKPIYAILNETAHSSAYALASAADRVFIPRTGSAGSIGVRMVHRDITELNKRVGVRVTNIYAGARKIDLDPNSEITPEARAAAQAVVDEHYEIFVKTIARNRGISPKAVRETEAAVYMGKNAVDVGLADAVASWPKAMAEINKNKNKGGSKMEKLSDKLRAITAEEKPEAIAEAFSSLGYVSRESVAPPDGVIVPKPNAAAIATALGITEEQLSSDLKSVNFAARMEEAEKKLRAQIVGVLEVCALGGMDSATAIGMVTSGISVEDARKKVLESRGKQSSQTTINSTVGSVSTGVANPVVVEAQRRAEAAKTR